MTLRTSSALHLNVSGALFIVLEDVIRMVKQTERTRKLNAVMEKEKAKEMERQKDNERGREKEKLRKTYSLTHCKSMDVTEIPSNRPRTGTLDLHFPVIDTQDDRDKEAEIERALFEQARGRRKSINQRFRSNTCEDEEQAYDLEVSTKSESLTYASFNRRKAGHISSHAHGSESVQVPDTSTGKHMNKLLTLTTATHNFMA